MASPSLRFATEELAPVETGSRGLGWAIYGLIVLAGFAFGVIVGNQRPKTIEVVKNVPVETKNDPKPSDKKELEKKEPEKKLPEVKPEPKPMIEPKPEPKPEVKPEPKPEPKPSPEPKPPTIVQVSFDKEVKAVFISKCVNCHGAIGKPKGDLDLRTLASIAKGGKTGDALKGGDLKNSLIWTQIVDEAMPPPDSKLELTEADKLKIKNWILSGGK